MYFRNSHSVQHIAEIGMSMPMHYTRLIYDVYSYPKIVALAQVFHHGAVMSLTFHVGALAIPIARCRARFSASAMLDEASCSICQSQRAE
jgi:hypothetical protein